MQDAPASNVVLDDAPPNRPTQALDDKQREELKNQWSTSIDTFRYLFDLVSKVWGFIAAADAAVLGYGFISGTAGPIFISAALTALIGAVTYIVYHGLLPVGFAAYDAEIRLGVKPGLVQVTARTLSVLAEDFDQIRREGEAPQDEVVVGLRKLRWKPRIIGRGITVVLVVGTSFQLLIGGYYIDQGAALFATHAPAQPTPASSPSPTMSAQPTP